MYSDWHGMKYALVGDHGLQPKARNTDSLISKQRWYGARFQMVILTMLGAGAMLSHHFFCSFMEGKEVKTDPLLVNVSEQALIGVAGNAIASVGSFTLGTAIGIVFVQVLWSRLRNVGYAIGHIQAIMECRTSPFSPTAWYAWPIAWKLTLLALLSAATTLITIFAPSALRSEAQNSVNAGPCTIRSVDMTGGSYGTIWPDSNGMRTWTPSPDVKRMVAQNLMTGSYIPPASPCGSCSYNLSFSAPAMSCTDITSLFDFSPMLLNSPELIVWNSTHDIYRNGSTLNIATMEGYNVNMQAATCKVFNATYTVDVTHNGTSSDINILNVVAYQPINAMNPAAPGNLAVYTIALATAQMLYGLGAVNLDTMENIINNATALDYNPYYYFSRLGQPGAPGSRQWQWEPSMLTALPQLMMNVSISMLSNPLGAATVDVDAYCRYSSIVYVYDEFHLAVAYGTGLLVTAVCVVIGFWTVNKNGREESLDFSRLMVAILTPDLYNEELNKEMKIRAIAERGPRDCSKFVIDRNKLQMT